MLITDSQRILLPSVLSVGIQNCLMKCSVIFKADKKAHHNALERKRRDHIKESFSGLRDCIPALKNEKVCGTFVKVMTNYL